MNQLVEIKRVKCRGEAGRTYTVVYRQKIINDARYGKAKGSIDLVTTEGEHVNLLDDGRYQLVMTDEILIADE